MAKFSEFEFSRMFRMTRAGFEKLLGLVSPAISVCKSKAVNSSGSSISNVARLAATLRWLAGGSYLDICGMFGLDASNFYKKNYILWQTILAINTCIDLGFSLDRDDLKKSAKEFSVLSKDTMNGCVLAVDGWICKTRMPTFEEVGQSIISYRNRKFCWGILVIAGCDATCKFKLFSARSSGGTHDHVAWGGCQLYNMISQNHLPEEYYFIGDEAFVNTNQFLIPWSGTGLGKFKDSFNYHLSSMRQCIERAFGLLTQRWGIFWRPLRCRYIKKRFPQIPF